MALESRQGFLLGGGLPAMLWMLWPRWLTGKGLPLLGAVLLRKREKQGPQWRQWQVKLGHGPEESWKWPPVKTENCLGMGFDLTWDQFAPAKQAELKLCWLKPWLLKIILPSLN